jgi:hypothetical protein
MRSVEEELKPKTITEGGPAKEFFDNLRKRVE